MLRRPMATFSYSKSINAISQHLGTTTGTQDLGSVWVDTTGKPRRTELTEAGAPSMLSMVVAVSVVQRVRQAGEGVTGEKTGQERAHDIGLFLTYTQ
jgi:hypothetical protein